MAYTENHAVLQFGGPTNLNQEEWSCSLRLKGAGADQASTEVEDNILAGSYLAAIQSSWTGATGLASSAFHLKYAKYNRIGLDGKYRNPWTGRLDLALAVKSSKTSNLMPAQICIVTSLRTAAARGLANSGRIFLPSPGESLASENDLRISEAARDTYAAKIGGLLDAINAVDVTQHVAVMSKVREGMARRVTHIEVGRVLDTMRSRRTSLPEEREVVQLAA